VTSAERQRAAMVRDQLVTRGIVDPRVLQAFATVPREAFVPEQGRGHAYEDRPLPIGAGQTISQPYVVAFMAEALRLGPDDHVLEVGAGSGYAAAILSRLARDVVAVERIPDLAATAAATLTALGYDTVAVRAGDGSVGAADEAPFEAVCVSASGPDVPPALIDQLTPGGRLVMPVGDRSNQRLVRIVRAADGDVSRQDIGSVRFVPLVGEQGWRPAPPGRQHRG
jgi:protein-L-isoaspartate(D-aspartate) O-methyltransferase